MADKSLAFNFIGRDKSLGKTLRGVGKDADKAHNSLASFAGGLAGGALASGLVEFGKSSVEAFKEAEQSQAALAEAFRKFPKLADTNVEALGKYNSALARKTVYDDDAIGSGQAVLAQFNLTGKQIQKLTPLLLDYASKTGTDLPTAAQNLGRAFMGNTRALKNLGINYKSTGNASKDFENIQGLLNTKVGGFAEDEGKTAAGQAKILSNQYGEVQETVGSKLVPALNHLGGELLTVIDFTQRNSNVVKPLVITIGGFAAAVWGVNKAVKAWQATEKAFLVVKGLFTTAVVAEGAAAGTTATAVGALATTETAAGVAGTAGAVGVGAFAVSVSTLAAGFAALVASGYFAYKFGDLAMHGGDGGGDFAHQPLDPNQPGGSANSGSSGTFRQGSKTLTPDTRFVQPRHFGLAAGGPMKAGLPYLVGEKGPELITPRRSGYVHTAAKTRRLFNPNVRLDTSQVSDNRLMSQMMMTPLSGRQSYQGAYAPAGMREYITHTSKVSLDGRPIGRSVTRTQRRSVRNGAKMTFGL